MLHLLLTHCYDYVYYHYRLLPLHDSCHYNNNNNYYYYYYYCLLATTKSKKRNTNSYY